MSMFEKIPHISYMVQKPIKVTIVNISKTIKDIIKSKRHIKLEYKGRVFGYVELFFVGSFI